MNPGEVVFVDANVFMYLVGSDGDLRQRCRSALRHLVERQITLVTSVEVLQELLHRFSALNRIETACAVYETAVDVCVEILPVTERHTSRALDLLQGHKRLSARDALHVATMEQRGVRWILSTDRDFDDLDTVERLDPAVAAAGT